MQIILTHEQADFDAIAALLGAYLLQVGAYAILPRNQNRNVQTFLKYHSIELPFSDLKEIPNEPIDTITLVDTQSLITLKNMSKDTSVYVLDHHQKKESFPQNWQFTFLPTGASTTYFVEQLAEQNGNLSIIEATLLLLGIYEDTGTLTYSNTTVRDVQAVAFLLSQGASLKIATEFLNPPLSKQQQFVFDQLITNFKTEEIENLKIIISYTKAINLKDEVSSIAHKICDLLDPDALFIFVETRDGIRFVARSTNDQVNVAEIAGLFGGGGHAKAAAALIQKKEGLTLEIITNKFINELPKKIHPAILVKDIMSEHPLLISPKTTAIEAADLMRKFGYEGYPVIDDGKLIGLLTRKAVDHARYHNLNLTASSLMDAGSFYVHPSDSLQRLQEVMGKSNWGQIPVVHRKTNRVVGIVTRTDLLKSLSGFSQANHKKINLKSQLDSALSISQNMLIHLISELAHSKSLPIYIVGGFVRDLILNLSSPDFDFVVEGEAIDLAKSLSKEYGGRVTTHKQFGTAKWTIGAKNKIFALIKKQSININGDTMPKSVDFISARTEFYSRPSALPTVRKSSLKLDLHRRDFTINTLAVRLDGEHFGDLYDFWGGLEDLQNGIVRVLHSLSFVDDPTRLLRAVRFEQRFGFEIEPRTFELMNEAKTSLSQVSGDRIRHELDQIFEEKQALKIMSRLDTLGLLQAIHNDLFWIKDMDDTFQKILNQRFPKIWAINPYYGKYPTSRILVYCLWISQFNNTVRKEIINRLRIPKLIADSINQFRFLIINQDKLNSNRPSEIVHFLEKTSPPILFALWLMLEDESKKSQITKYIEDYSNIQIYTDGNTLSKKGLKPSPKYQEILSTLRNAWLDGEISTQAEEEKYLQNLLDCQ